MLWADSDKEFETGNVCFVCIQREMRERERISQPAGKENVYFSGERKGGKWALKCQRITCTIVTTWESSSVVFYWEEEQREETGGDWRRRRVSH